MIHTAELECEFVTDVSFEGNLDQRLVCAAVIIVTARVFDLTVHVVAIFLTAYLSWTANLGGEYAFVPTTRRVSQLTFIISHKLAVFGAS